jgi:hypothetical protein
MEHPAQKALTIQSIVPGLRNHYRTSQLRFSNDCLSRQSLPFLRTMNSAILSSFPSLCFNFIHAQYAQSRRMI